MKTKKEKSWIVTATIKNVDKSYTRFTTLLEEFAHHYVTQCDMRLNSEDGKTMTYRFFGTWALREFNAEQLPGMQLMLRPLSDMTKEEKIEYNSRKQRRDLNKTYLNADNTHWLITRKFDLFGLIPFGYAVDASKNDYYGIRNPKQTNPNEG